MRIATPAFFCFPFAWNIFFHLLTFSVYVSSVVFLDYVNHFNIFCKAGLVVLNSLNFCLSEKLFISPSILNEILAGYHHLGYRFFPFSTLHISYILFWPAEFRLKFQLLNIWDFPCMILVAFPLLLLIFFLCVLSLLF